MGVGVFCFKQKTAYEISTRDWSSDVCSSDLGGPNGRHDWNFCRERGVANNHFVFSRNFSARRVNNEIDVAVLDAVEHVRTALVNLENFGYFDFRVGQRLCRSAGGNDFKTEFEIFARDRNDRFLVGVFDADKDSSAFG